MRRILTQVPIKEAIKKKVEQITSFVSGEERRFDELKKENKRITQENLNLIVKHDTLLRAIESEKENLNKVIHEKDKKNLAFSKTSKNVEEKEIELGNLEDEVDRAFKQSNELSITKDKEIERKSKEIEKLKANIDKESKKQTERENEYQYNINLLAVKEEDLIIKEKKYTKKIFDLEKKIKDEETRFELINKKTSDEKDNYQRIVTDNKNLKKVNNDLLKEAVDNKKEIERLEKESEVGRVKLRKQQEHMLSLISREDNLKEHIPVMEQLFKKVGWNIEI